MRRLFRLSPQRRNRPMPLSCRNHPPQPCPSQKRPKYTKRRHPTRILIATLPREPRTTSRCAPIRPFPRIYRRATRRPRWRHPASPPRRTHSRSIPFSKRPLATLIKTSPCWWRYVDGAVRCDAMRFARKAHASFLCVGPHQCGQDVCGRVCHCQMPQARTARSLYFTHQGAFQSKVS